LSGPVKRNRIFFFGAYDGFRKRQASAPRFFSIPTMRERTGDFSEFPAQIYDPATTNCGSGPCTRLPFANNRNSSKPHFHGVELYAVVSAGGHECHHSEQLSIFGTYWA
jgi:hypothetical protein